MEYLFNILMAETGQNINRMDDYLIIYKKLSAEPQQPAVSETVQGRPELFFLGQHPKQLVAINFIVHDGYNGITTEQAMTYGGSRTSARTPGTQAIQSAGRIYYSMKQVSVATPGTQPQTPFALHYLYIICLL
jgi:hypothetical protein